ncbi:hypothetical protein GCM10023347_07670 [Streptomyces chumphonensis]|uniref:Uncharacterized protein n=1 Tax=Streptomyces chumphonensis TaxID=1214925 RepID=A0A927ID86_9ACTN|nr:hypothetical protein [Streptomyces chumphonensis]MBD3934843.1 hypothetical protein [Streptomyces chumphonensis]
MDANKLFTEAGLRSFVDKRRDQHLADAQQYGQLAGLFAARLRQSPIEGDWPMEARLRAYRVVRHLRKLEKDSRHAASDAEALHAAYTHQVLELPARRERAALKRAKAKDSRARRRALRRSKVAAGLEQPQPTNRGYSFRLAGGGEQMPHVTDIFAKQRKEG